MARARNRFFEIHDAVKGLIFEAWAGNEKEALQFGRFRVWAPDKSHPGLRRILRPSDPWAVLVEEANYLTAAREPARPRAATPSAAELEQRAQQWSEQQAAEKAAYVRRLEALRVDQAERRERRLALDARLGRHRPIPSLPTQDPTTGTWI